MQDFLTARMAELGIPDWRISSAYPDPDDLMMSDWRWEFLRRNPQYRQDYKRSELSFEHEDKEGYFEQVYLLKSPIDPRLSVKQHVQSRDGQFFRSYFFDNFIGVESLSSKYSNWREIDRIMYHRSFHDIFFRVDPLKPLDPQFDAFISIARTSQRSLLGKILKPRTRNDKWPLYLRVLDGRDCEATYPEIARVCLKHEDQSAAIGAARDLLKQARKLRDAWPFAAEGSLNKLC